MERLHAVPHHGTEERIAMKIKSSVKAGGVIIENRPAAR